MRLDKIPKGGKALKGGEQSQRQLLLPLLRVPYDDQVPLVCVCVCMYVRTYVRMYVCIYVVCMYVYVFGLHVIAVYHLSTWCHEA